MIPMRVAALLLLAACSGSPPGIAHAKRIDADEFFAGPTSGRLLAAVLPPDVFGSVRVVYPPTRCTFGGPVPVFVQRREGERPVAGLPFTATFAVDYPAPYQERLVSVLASTRPLATPVAIGANCWLLTHPDFVMLPGPQGSILTYRDGALVLSLTPSSALVGQTFYLQALVAVPGGTSIGHVVSPLLIVEVGSR